MGIERKMIGQPLKYKGRLITIYFLGPDLLAQVDGTEVSSFWIDSQHAINGAKRYIDELEKEVK